MTDTDVDIETRAQQLAARGRERLVERTRAAYSNAAAAQADLITLDDQHIEALVQAAADRADGLQWRRALAAVAAEELGLSASDALSHPAVVRAQMLVGAPSYEQSLAELIARPVPPVPPVTPTQHQDPNPANYAPSEPAAQPPEPVSEYSAPAPEELAASEWGAVQTPEQSAAASQWPAADPENSAYAPPAEPPSDELETVEADDVVLELLPEPDPAEYAYETEPDPITLAPDSTALAPDPTALAPDPTALASDPTTLAPDPTALGTDFTAVETQAYDVEASFTEESLPPAPANPFAAAPAAPTEEPEAHASEIEQPLPADEDPPPTDVHHNAGVAAAIAAVSVPGSVPDPVQEDPDAEPTQPTAEREPEPEPEPEPEEENIEVSFPAVHLGGVANLPTKREGLSVRLSADGLDIMEGPREIIGRLVWTEIEALEVPNLRVRRRQKTVRARLVVRTPHGDASFEVPEVTADELRDRVEPLVRLYAKQ